MAKDQDPSATKFCSNCKRDIPALNYLMHQNHCIRNIVLCGTCEEPVPHTEMDQHNEENHVKVTCKCGEAVEKCRQEEHDAEDCPQRQITCEYCEMGMDFKNLAEHKDFCGSRTEPCSKCVRYIYFRDKVRHEATDCKWPEVKPVKPNPVQPTAATVGDPFLQNDLLLRSAKSNQYPPGLLEQFTGPPLLRPGAGKGHPGSFGVLEGGLGDRKHRKNQDRVQNVMTRNPARGREKNEERALLQSAASQEELDRHLAHRLAHDLPVDPWPGADDLSAGIPGQSRTGPTPFFDDFQDDIAIQELIKDSYSIPAINTFQGQGTVLGDVTLPCEFCQQPIPAETLIQHQSGCRPDLACYPAESAQTNNSRRRGPSLPQPPTEVLNNRTYGSTLPGVDSVDLSDVPATFTEDNLLMLACEFCEELLPADALPMHQVYCSDLRMVTPAPATFDPSPGSYPTRRGGPNESPVRPKPARVQRPQNFPSRPRKQPEGKTLADHSIDDDDGIDVDSLPAEISKPRNQPQPQPKSRLPRNAVSLAPQFPSDTGQQGTGQVAPFPRSASEKYLHGTGRAPRPTATVSSLPSGGAVREMKTNNTGQSRYRQERPQSKSSARVQETLQGLRDVPPSDYDGEELRNLLGARLVPAETDGDTNSYTQVKCNPLSKPKTVNFPRRSGLEMDDHPPSGEPQFAPTVVQDNRPQPHACQGSGARQKVRRNHPHRDGGNQGNAGGGYHPRKGGDPERKGHGGGTRRPKQPLAATTMTHDPDDLTSPLRVRGEPSAHRTSNQKQGQRRRTAAQKNTRLREDPVL